MSTAIARLLLCVFIISCSTSILVSQNNNIRPESKAYDMPEYIKAKQHLDNRRYPEAEVLIVEILAKLKEEGTTQDYIEMLNLHAKSIMHQWRTEESLAIYKEMKVLAKEAKLPLLHSNAIQALIVTYEFLDSFHLIEKLVIEGRAIKNLPQADYSNYHLAFSEVWKRNNNIDSALHYSNWAYKIDKEINDSISLPKTCQTIATLLKSNNEYDNALEYLIEGMSYIKGENNYKHSYFNNDIAIVMLQIRNIEKAKFYANESVRISRLNNLKSSLSHQLAILALIEEIDGNHKKALDHYKEALEINKEPKKFSNQLRITKGLIGCKLNLNQKVSPSEMKVLMALKARTDDKSTQDGIDKIYLRYRIEKGITPSEFNAYSTKLIKEFESRNDLYDLRDMYQLSYNYFTKIQNYKSANIALESYITYKDKIFKEQQEFKILELESKYDKLQDEKRIVQLAATNDAQANALRQQTKFLVTASIGFIVISLLSFFLYKYYRKVKKQNEVVSLALREKDFLLREIHHRVKNNLQVISSLLSLQARQMDNEEVQKAINEGRNRVRSMALIHQNLYQNENLNSVSVNQYLSRLLTELFETYNVDDNRIKLNLDLEDIDLDVDTMVPFGLILNELVSNCLKHAFPNDQLGTITISLKDIDGILHLSVKDNGIGIDKSEMIKSKSFGNRLITAFTKKLHAELEVLNENGTHVNLKIKNYKKAS